MLSKRGARARITAALAVALLASCAGTLTQGVPRGQEVNLSFVIDNNFLRLPSVTIDGRRGRYLFGSAMPQSVIDTEFAGSQGSGHHVLALDPRQSLGFSPAVLAIRPAADAILGADLWGNHAVTIDYHDQLISYQRNGAQSGLMALYRYDEAPAVGIEIDGRTETAIVDTANGDTLVMPRGRRPAGRAPAHVVVAGIDFGRVDVRYADVSDTRLGNRLLSKFLISIDYGKHVVGMWRDPRIPM